MSGKYRDECQMWPLKSSHLEILRLLTVYIKPPNARLSLELIESYSEYDSIIIMENYGHLYVTYNWFEWIFLKAIPKLIEINPSCFTWDIYRELLACPKNNLHPLDYIWTIFGDNNIEEAYKLMDRNGKNGNNSQ